jgi:AraC-like DNA-binding protein
MMPRLPALDLPPLTNQPHRTAAEGGRGALRIPAGLRHETLSSEAATMRSLLRLQAALPALAAGDPVSAVARRAGYDTASAFVAAFRRETGRPPAAYCRNPP